VTIKTVVLEVEKKDFLIFLPVLPHKNFLSVTKK
jgi:hypothetical protein